MTKIVINSCHGGFELSEEAIIRYNELKGRQVWVLSDKEMMFNTYSLVAPEDRIDAGEIRSYSPERWFEMSDEERGEYNQKWSEQTFQARNLERDDPILVHVVEELGKAADSRFSELKVVEIPDDVEWQIEEYDGAEWIAEKHRTWS